MSRYTDLNVDMIFALAGWNKDARLGMYEEFIGGRNLVEAFTDFCRDKAEAERSEDEIDEDEEAAWEAAGAPLCPQCRLPFPAHKMACDIGRVGPKAYAEHVCPEMGAYYRHVVRYVEEVRDGEEEAQ